MSLVHGFANINQCVNVNFVFEKRLAACLPEEDIVNYADEMNEHESVITTFSN